MSENQPSARGAKPLFTLLLGLILFLFGVVVGYALSGNTSSAPGGKGYKEGFEAAKAEFQQRLEDSGLSQPALDIAALEAEPIYSLGGTVTSVSGKSITFDAALPTFSVLDKPVTKTYTARITDSTTLTKRSEMTPEELNASFDAFNEAQTAYDRKVTALLEDPDFNGDLPDPPEPPAPFIATTVDQDAFSEGMSVTVSSTEDLKTVSNFDATEISFFESNIDLLPPEEILPPDDVADILPEEIELR